MVCTIKFKLIMSKFINRAYKTIGYTLQGGFLLIIFISFVSCKRLSSDTSRKGEGNIACINVEKKCELSVFDIFSKIEIIPLEATESSLLYENLAKVTIHDNKYYVLPNKQNIIFVFDLQGKYLSQINKQGNGPGEYNELNDFGFNRFNGNLELMSAFGYINVYDTTGEIFKQRLMFLEIPVMHYFANISPDQYLFFSQARKEGKILCYDLHKEKTVSESYDLPEFLFFNTPYHHSYSPFYLCGDQLCFVQGYNGDVFTVEGAGKLSPRYQWDFGEYNFDISKLEDRSIEYYVKYARTIGSKYVNTFVAYGENSTYYMTRFKFRNTLYHLIFNKRDKSCKIFNSFKENCMCFPFVVDDFAAYSFVSPKELSFVINSEVLDEENKKKYESVTLDDNPIIIRYVFKK